MGSTINLLEHLRTKTQVDCDSLDLEVARKYGPFIDCTSNQADSYFEFQNPKRADLLQKSVAYAQKIQYGFPEVNLEELAVELCMVSVTLTVVPLISGSVHIMANPSYSCSTTKIVENGKHELPTYLSSSSFYGLTFMTDLGISKLCAIWDPEFDLTRLCIKVPSTWEGLQACRQLKAFGIRTLGTTLFTMEQAILAGEAGCVSISPFVHELKVHFDETYHDTDPGFELCVQAQQYFEKYEVMKIAGILALTLPPSLLQNLVETDASAEGKSVVSIFEGKNANEVETTERMSFLDDEMKYREAFAKNEGGKGESKTIQAIKLFCEYQIKAEALMRTLL